jgi:hypothetical protein
MALTDYAQYDEVRAALGVNDVELKDAVLALPIYLMGLVRELNKISTSLPAAFSAVAELAEDDRSDAQQALYDATRLFSAYAVAKQVGVSLPSFMPKDITDGKAAVGRFSGAPYEETLARIDQMFGALREDLATAYASYASEDAPSPLGPPTSFIAVARASDPVTGT